MNIAAKIKTELHELGIRPRKSLGQNFLVSEAAYKKIMDAAGIAKGDTVVEVGPGLGTLTEHLAETGAEILAVEKDRHLIVFLKDKFADRKNVKIAEGDILKLDPAYFTLHTPRYKVVGNIPYYITSRLLKIIFEKWPKPETIVLTVQKEVAQRIVAKPPEMSLLSVSVQYYAEPKIVSYISRGNFYPPPDVDSAIIKLAPFDEPKPKESAKKFFTAAKAGFAGKRKQLANNLFSFLKIPKKEIEGKLLSAGIDPRRRAETLTLEEWQKVSNIFP